MIVPGVVVVSPQALRKWLATPEHLRRCPSTITGKMCELDRLHRYDRPGHPLDGETLLRRETGLLEVACRHGVGHPIEESVELLERNGPKGSRGTWGIHGCDGCCRDAVIAHARDEGGEAGGA